MSKSNHHHLLNSAMNKIATRIYDKKDSKRNEEMLQPDAGLLNKRDVKNALTRNLRLSISEKLNMYKSYEDAIKHDQQSILEKQKELMARLTAVKPPLAPQASFRSNGGNKNLMINKVSLRKQTSKLGRDQVTKPKVFKKAMDHLTPHLPCLATIKPKKRMNSSYSSHEFKANSTMNNFSKGLHLTSQKSKDGDSSSSEGKPNVVYLKRMNLKLNHMTSSSLLDKFKNKW